MLTVRSLLSCFRTLLYSAMAFCSLPCWTNFSAALRTFCLLKPKLNAIGVRTPALFPAECWAICARVAERVELPPGNSRTKHRDRAIGTASNLIVRPGIVRPMVTDDYRGYQKGVYRSEERREGKECSSR